MQFLLLEKATKFFITTGKSSHCILQHETLFGLLEDILKYFILHFFILEEKGFWGR